MPGVAGSPTLQQSKSKGQNSLRLSALAANKTDDDASTARRRLMITGLLLALGIVLLFGFVFSAAFAAQGCECKRHSKHADSPCPEVSMSANPGTIHLVSNPAAPHIEPDKPPKVRRDPDFAFVLFTDYRLAGRMGVLRAQLRSVHAVKRTKDEPNESNRIIAF